jgi:hypothetical protein
VHAVYLLGMCVFSAEMFGPVKQAIFYFHRTHKNTLSAVRTEDVKELDKINILTTKYLLKTVYIIINEKLKEYASDHTMRNGIISVIKKRKTYRVNMAPYIVCFRKAALSTNSFLL